MQYTSSKRIPDKARLGGNGDPLGIAQESEIGPYILYMHKAESILKNDILWNFEIGTDHLIPARKSGPVVINNL